jgi:hypothetical protein
MNTLTLNSPKWIINKREDLQWLIFSALVGFVIIGIYYLLTGYYVLDKNICIGVIYLLWAMLFDATHAFATYTRTYFDNEYRENNKSLLWQSLIVFIIGPLFLISIFSVHTDLNETSAAFIVFNRFGLCFAYYHLIRQHWGFIVLYRKKNGETDEITRKLDGLLLMFGSIYPFVHGQFDKIEPMHISETLVIPIEAWLNVSIYTGIIGGVLLLLSFVNNFYSAKFYLRVISSINLIASVIINLTRYFTLSLLLQFVSFLCLIGFVLTIITYLVILFREKSTREQLTNNYPKWLLLITVLFSYNLILHLNLPLYVIIASLTIFHNIQYHKIVNYHNINKYKSGEEERFGFAVVLTQKIKVFIALALAFNLISYIPRVTSNILISSELINYILSSFFWGVAFHHYYLDSIIWKVRSDVKLSSALKI